jgi:hypothetical protein
MNRIRVAIVAALVLTAGFAGGTAHASHSQVHAPAVTGVASQRVNGPVLCCD